MQTNQNSENPREYVTDAETISTSEEKTMGHRPFQSAPRWAIIGIFLLMLVAAVAYARNFLLPVVLGFLLAMVFTPVRRFLERRGIPPGLSAFCIVGVLVAALATGVVLLSEPVRDWLQDAPDIGRQVEEKVKRLLGSTKTVVEAGEQVSKITSGAQDENVQEVVVRQPGVLADLASVAPSVLAQAVLTLVLLLFLLSSGDMFYEKLVHVMPRFKDKRRAMRIAYDIERNLSHYLFTITLINAALGAAIGAAMWLLGMPNPLLFGVIGFVFNFVPYLGAIFGMAIAAVVGLITFDAASYALLPAVVYFVLTTIEGQFATPYFVGRRLEMNTVVIFLSVAFWAWLWSVMGMLVAVPLLVTVRAFCEHIPPLESLGDFLSSRGRECEEVGDTADSS